jgi:hypothetical protein
MKFNHQLPPTVLTDLFGFQDYFKNADYADK